KNYGWPDQEGFGGTAKGFTDPIWTSGAVTYATSGATFVTGDQWGAWAGSLFVATLKEQDLRRFAVSGTTIVPKEVLYDQKYGGRCRRPRPGGGPCRGRAPAHDEHAGSGRAAHRRGDHPRGGHGPIRVRTPPCRRHQAPHRRRRRRSGRDGRRRRDDRWRAVG